MPVYGVEKFVGKAIDSILAQTLTEWELFAVDDGSEDMSGKICDEYAKKDAAFLHLTSAGSDIMKEIEPKKLKKLTKKSMDFYTTKTFNLNL